MGGLRVEPSDTFGNVGNIRTHAAALLGGTLCKVSHPIKLLLVEDDERLARYTERYLTAHDVRVTLASDGASALADAGQRQYDVVLLDLNLPGVDGYAVCRALRQRSDVPVIMVTARTEETDRLRGFDCGADDYVSKPFSVRELLARVEAVVRRARGQVGPRGGVRRVGTLVLDGGSMEATLAGVRLELTPYEFAILYAMAERAGRPVSREQLLDLVKDGGADEVFDRSIDVRVSRLRQKLGDDPKRPRFLKTIRGVGYLLAAPEG